MRKNTNTNANVEDIQALFDANLVGENVSQTKDLTSLTNMANMTDMAEMKAVLLDLIKSDEELIKTFQGDKVKESKKKKPRETKEELYIENLVKFNDLLKLPASRHRERKDICFNDCRMIKLLMDEFSADAIYRKFSDEESVEGTLAMVLTKQNHVGKYNYHIISVTEIDLIENYEYTHCYELCKNIYEECTVMLHDDLIKWDYLDAVAKYLRNIISCNYSFIRPLKRKH